jgi:hypothetical protein
VVFSDLAQRLSSTRQQLSAGCSKTLKYKAGQVR